MGKALKGGGFERDFARRLSLWWTQDLKPEPRDDVFWRTAGSGARATTRKKQGKDTAFSQGDIGVIDPIGIPLLKAFVIECKRGYNRSTIADLLDKPEGAKKQEYEEWIEKCIRCKEAAGSFSWILVHKRDRREPIVVAPTFLFYKLNCCGAILQAKTQRISCGFDTELPLYCVTLDFFLKNLKPKNVELLLELNAK